MSKLPSGDLVKKVKAENAKLSDVIPKKNKKIFAIRVTGEGTGWVVLQGKKKVLGAYYNDISETFGEGALAKIANELRKGCTAEVEMLPKHVVDLYFQLNPAAIVNKEIDLAMFESRIQDLENSIGDGIDVSQFTEEWENQDEEYYSNLVNTAPESITTSITVSQMEEEGSSEGAKEETKIVAESTEKHKKTVDNLSEFISSLKGFTGRVFARDGSTDFEIYVKDGEVVGALVKDEDFEIKGLPALYYLDTRAEVSVEEGQFEVPADLVCEEDPSAVKAFYTELDRSQ